MNTLLDDLIDWQRALDEKNFEISVAPKTIHDAICNYEGLVMHMAAKVTADYLQDLIEKHTKD